MEIAADRPRSDGAHEHSSPLDRRIGYHGRWAMGSAICLQCRKPDHNGGDCTWSDEAATLVDSRTGESADSREFTERPATLLLGGTYVGEYRIEKVIGVGGMGNVYLAVQ